MPIVILPNVRLAFFHGWRPSDPRNGADGKPIAGKYGAQGIWAPGSDADKMARAAFMEAATAKWGPNAGNVVRSLSKDKKCLRVGNEMLTKDSYTVLPLVDRGRLSAASNTLGGVVLNTWDSEMWNVQNWTRLK